MKKAYWIRQEHLFRAEDYTCSSCGSVSAEPYVTCPGCGALMKAVRYDPAFVDEAEELSAILVDDW